MKSTDILKPQEQNKKPPRIDLEFEQMVLRCGIGCLVRDIPMSDNDYLRLELAFSRLGRKP